MGHAGHPPAFTAPGPFQARYRQARLLQDERDRAEQLGALAELTPSTISTSSAARRDGTKPHRLAQRLEEHLAGGADAAADDDALGVDEVAEVGHGDADVAAGIGDRTRRQPGSPSERALDDVLDRRASSPRLRRSSSTIAGGAGVGLQAAAVAAATDVDRCSSTVVWPISPAVPPAPPEQASPSTIRPAPIPVDSLR